jgi:hypothetical protein
VIATSATVVWWLSPLNYAETLSPLLNFLWMAQVYAQFIVIGSVATAFVCLLKSPMTAKLVAIPLSSRGIGFDREG